MKKHGYILGLLTILLSAQVMAQQARIRMYFTEPLIVVGQTANLVIEFENHQGLARPEIPDKPGLRFIYAGTEQSMSYTNGEQTRSVRYKYKAIPSRVGTYKVGPFNYPHQGKNLTIPQASLEVVKEGEATADSQPLIARLEISRSDVVVQEVFDLTLKVFYRDITLDNQINLLNSFDDVFKVERFQEISASPEKIQGLVYQARAFRAKARATQAGTYELAPVLQVGVVQPQRNRSNRYNPFSDFMRFRRTEPVQLVAKAPPLQVRNPPKEGQPASFDGAVGSFDFTVSVSPLELQAGDPITITTELTGRGNIDILRPTEMPETPDLKTYAMQMERSELNDAKTAGVKTFKQVVIPKTDALTELGPFTFSYFDPNEKKYKEIKRGPYAITVRAGDNASRSTIISDQTDGSETPSTPEQLGDDLIYLKPLPETWHQQGQAQWYHARPVRLFQLAPLFGMMAVIYLKRRTNLYKGNEQLRRRQEAPKAARAGLHQARKAIAEEDDGLFQEGLWKALTGFLGNQFNLPPGNIQPEQIDPRLKEHPEKKALLADLRDWFAYHEASRYGVKHTRTLEEMKQALSETETMIKQLERLSK